MGWEYTLTGLADALYSYPSTADEEELQRHLAEVSQAEGMPHGTKVALSTLVSALAAVLAERARLCDRVVELQRREQSLTELQRDLLFRTEELTRELDATGRRHLVLAERNRIAQDLHDRAAQTLFLIDLKSQWLLNHMSPESPAYSEMEKLRELATQGSAQLREAIYALRASELKQGGLVPGLGQLVTRLEEEGLSASFTVTGRAQELTPEQEDAIFMIAQEALSNVRKHSQACAVVVALRYGPDNVTLVVQDDGTGLSPGVLEDPKRLGVRGMKERARALNGELSLISGDESGLIVRASIPYMKG